MKRILYFLVGCLALSFLVGCEKNPEMTEQFTPIIDNNGADPWLWQEADTYYYTKTTGDNLTLWRSKNLTDVAAGEKKVLWQMPESFESIWAPELHHIGKDWYIYFAANRANETHRMYAVVNHNADPYEGEWELTEIKGMDDKFAIDGTVFSAKGKDYFIWSGWEGYENVAQNLYIAEMISPTEIKSEKIMLSKPDFQWEKKQTPLVNEGPQVLIKNQQINLVYSASGSWDNDYCLGLLTADLSSDLLNPSSWQKHLEPVFQQGNGVYGPGHCSFVKSKDGKEDWLIYHAARWDHSGWERSIRLQQFKWHDDDTPDFGKPVESSSFRQLPASEPKRYVVSAEKGERSDGLIVKEDATVNGKVVEGFESWEDQLKFQFDLPEGKYKLFIYTKYKSYDDTQEEFNLVIKTGEESQTLPVYPSEYYQPVQLEIGYKTGDELAISSEIGLGVLQINRIELVPE